jgi:hypothetical protein
MRSAAALRVSVEEHPSGALVVLERPDMAGRPRILLDGYGVDVLSGYIMSARLAVPHDLPDEHVDGIFGTRFRLGLEPCATLALHQTGAGDARYSGTVLGPALRRIVPGRRPCPGARASGGGPCTLNPRKNTYGLARNTPESGFAALRHKFHTNGSGVTNGRW